MASKKKLVSEKVEDFKKSIEESEEPEIHRKSYIYNRACGYIQAAYDLGVIDIIELINFSNELTKAYETDIVN